MNRNRRSPFWILPILAVFVFSLAPKVALSQKKAPLPPDDPKCVEFYRNNLDAEMEDAMKAGCQPTMAMMSEMMNNPIGTMALFPIQYDWYRYLNSETRTERNIHSVSFIPTWPFKLGKKVQLVNRMFLQFPSMPIRSDIGDEGSFPPVPGSPTLPPGGVPEGFSPFGRTTGFGDMTYVGLFGPRNPPKVGKSSLLLAAGPVFTFPTASAAPLGAKKWSSGVSGLVGILGDKWQAGVLPMQFWSFAGAEERPDVRLSNIQYFISHTINPEWAIGISPNIVIDWTQGPGNKLTFPFGMGVNHTVMLGKVPARVAVDLYYSIVRPDTIPGSRWDLRISLTPALPAFLLGL